MTTRPKDAAAMIVPVFSKQTSSLECSVPTADEEEREEKESESTSSVAVEHVDSPYPYELIHTNPERKEPTPVASNRTYHKQREVSGGTQVPVRRSRRLQTYVDYAANTRGIRPSRVSKRTAQEIKIPKDLMVRFRKAHNNRQEEANGHNPFHREMQEGPIRVNVEIDGFAGWWTCLPRNHRLHDFFQNVFSLGDIKADSSFLLTYNQVWVDPKDTPHSLGMTDDNTIHLSWVPKYTDTWTGSKVWP